MSNAFAVPHYKLLRFRWKNSSSWLYRLMRYDLINPKLPSLLFISDVCLTPYHHHKYRIQLFIISNKIAGGQRINWELSIPLGQFSMHSVREGEERYACVVMQSIGNAAVEAGRLALMLASYSIRPSEFARFFPVAFGEATSLLMGESIAEYMALWPMILRQPEWFYTNSRWHNYALQLTEQKKTKKFERLTMGDECRLSLLLTGKKIYSK